MPLSKINFPFPIFKQIHIKGIKILSTPKTLSKISTKISMEEIKMLMVDYKITMEYLIIMEDLTIIIFRQTSKKVFIIFN